jgi:hypothetical protein
MKHLKQNIIFTIVGLLSGFAIKVIFDYFYSQNLLLNLSKATILISNENIIDSISFANQVGRLDLVSLLLAFLGIILGFGTILGFWELSKTQDLQLRKRQKSG